MCLLLFQEPFTTAHIQFHDGVFDQGNRMFSSVHQSWLNVCSDSANVKVRLILCTSLITTPWNEDSSMNRTLGRLTNQDTSLIRTPSIPKVSRLEKPSVYIIPVTDNHINTYTHSFIPRNWFQSCFTYQKCWLITTWYVHVALGFMSRGVCVCVCACPTVLPRQTGGLWRRWHHRRRVIAQLGWLSTRVRSFTQRGEKTLKGDQLVLQ